MDDFMQYLPWATFGVIAVVTGIICEALKRIGVLRRQLVREAGWFYVIQDLMPVLVGAALWTVPWPIPEGWKSLFGDGELSGIMLGALAGLASGRLYSLWHRTRKQALVKRRESLSPTGDKL